MKLPRWLVMGMLASSVLAVLAAAGWWWVTWPQRTAREFAELMAAGKQDEAWRMISTGSEPQPAWTRVADSPTWADWTPSQIEPVSRTLWAIFAARQEFEIPAGHTVEVKRGSIETVARTWVSGDVRRTYQESPGEIIERTQKLKKSRVAGNRTNSEPKQ